MKTLKDIYKKRETHTRKYDYGMVVVIGGSQLYSGSPSFSALAAVRAGADIAKIVAPRRAADIAASFSPSLITFPLDGKCLSLEHLPELLSLTRSAEIVSRGRVSVVIGGGAGRSQETKEAIRKYLEETSLPVVIDADAIYSLEEEKIDLKGKSFLFTPHVNEFLALTGKDVKEFSDKEREEAIKEEAGKISSTILLKGKTDFVSDGESVLKNEISVPHLATGGCGDVLAGVAGALLSRGFSTMDSAYMAALINSKAGDVAAKEKGDGLMAMDVVEKIPEIIRQSSL